MLRPGGNVDSWCGKCKMMLAHTIEAMVGDKPARVQCNTCKSQHGYKANAPATAARKPKTEQAGAAVKAPRGKARPSRYQTLLSGKDVALAKGYSSSNSYQPGDVLKHPTFGVGVTTAVRDETKIEVLFQEGTKLLIQGR